MFGKKFVTAAAALALMSTVASAETISWLSQSQQISAQYPVETAAMDAINADGFTVNRGEFQVLGINLADALRTASQGSFNIVSTQIGSAARDDAFLEGIDLIGVATDLPALKTAVDAYREAFNKRMEDRFGVKALAIWPFGPQVFFCNEAITKLDDMKNMKVRSFTASMSTLLTEIGASPVTLSFPEVYPALERGVAQCGVTSPTSANTGKWPEVTSYILPVSVSGSVQAHLVNLEWWNGLSEENRAKLEGHFAKMEAELWAIAETTNEAALSCTVGGECKEGGLYQPYKLTLVDLTEEDMNTVKKISSEKILSEWAGRCEATYEGCANVWNDTIGKALSIAIPAK